MTKNEIVGRLKDGGLDASSTNRRAAVYVADAIAGRAVPGWFAFRIVCDSVDTERRARAILSRWYDIDVGGNGVWRMRSKNRVPLMAIKRGGGPTPEGLEPLYIEAVEAGADFYIDSSRNDLDIEYSTDGGQTWTTVTWTAGEYDDYVTEVFTLSAVGDKVWIRGDNPQGLNPTEDDYFNFRISADSEKKVRLGGCVCSLVSKMPESVTVLPARCFSYLFDRGYIVGKAASLGNVTSIGDNGCDYMYYSCTSLTSAADMPLLTSIGDYGCSYMYNGCTLLTAAADMPLLASIGDGGCDAMYGDCTFAMSSDGTTLNFDFPTPPVTAGETTYATAYEIAQWMGNTNGFTPPPPTPTDGPMYFEAAQAGSTVSLMSMLTTAPNLEYSTDGTTWQEWQHTTADNTHTFDTLTLTAVGDRVYLRGDNPNGLADMQNQQISNFSMTGKINAGGNIMSLLDKTMVLTVVPASGFAMLFGDMTSGQNPNTALLTPPAMDTITSIGEIGCYNMFGACTSLTSAADMPSITTIGEGGCGNMYLNCTSLTSAADMSAITSIGESGCIRMYFGCTSLTSAADMPSLTTIGEEGCGKMYLNCTFAMSSDGTTLNFAFPTPPITTAGDEPETYATAYDIADWMGNTNGFTTP